MKPGKETFRGQGEQYGEEGRIDLHKNNVPDWIHYAAADLNAQTAPNIVNFSARTREKSHSQRGSEQIASYGAPIVLFRAEEAA